MIPFNPPIFIRLRLVAEVLEEWGTIGINPQLNCVIRICLLYHIDLITVCLFNVLIWHCKCINNRNCADNTAASCIFIISNDYSVGNETINVAKRKMTKQNDYMRMLLLLFVATVKHESRQNVIKATNGLSAKASSVSNGITLEDMWLLWTHCAPFENECMRWCVSVWYIFYIGTHKQILCHFIQVLEKYSRQQPENLPIPM